MMRPNIIWPFLQLHELRQQFLAFGNVGIVDFVVPDIIPVMGQFPQPRAGINANLRLLQSLGRHGGLQALRDSSRYASLLPNADTRQPTRHSYPQTTPQGRQRMRRQLDATSAAAA